MKPNKLKMLKIRLLLILTLFSTSLLLTKSFANDASPAPAASEPAYRSRGATDSMSQQLPARVGARVLDPDFLAEHKLNQDKANQDTGTIPVEIERKFLINPNDLPPRERLQQFERFEITQSYISYDPEIRLRRVDSLGFRNYYFTIKLPKDEIGLARSELEFEISQPTYQKLVGKRIGGLIEKTRYQFVIDAYEVSVDIYHDRSLAGLAVAEVEFSDAEKAKAFKPFAWFGRDVTSDKNYKNANLSKNGKPKP